MNLFILPIDTTPNAVAVRVIPHNARANRGWHPATQIGGLGMKWVILILCLSGCANAIPDNIFQAEAVKTFAHYNSMHHLNIPVPQVYIGATPGPFAGSTWCPMENGVYTHCSITLNPSRSFNMEQTLIHEEAHVICVLSKNCKPTDHDKAWQEIALKLGLNSDDSYVAISQE